jgi:hypothetical protein
MRGSQRSCEAFCARLLTRYFPLPTGEGFTGCFSGLLLRFLHSRATQNQLRR